MPMNDALPVADLDPPARPPAARALPLLWVVVGVLLIGAVVAAVVNSGGGRSPQERVAAAPAAVTEARTFAYEITSSTKLGGTAVDVKVAGDVDAATKRSTAEFDMLGTKFSFLADERSLYVQVPEAARATVGGKSWVKLDLSTMTNGALGAPAGGLGGVSPLQSFEQLRKAGTEVKDLGAEDVRGVSTTRYRTVLDLSGQAAQIPATPGLDPEALRKTLSNVPVDIWLDGNDLIRRQRTTLQISVPGLPGGSATVTTTVEAFDYGKAVTIDLPPEADVASGDISTLGGLFLPNAGAGGSGTPTD